MGIRSQSNPQIVYNDVFGDTGNILDATPSPAVQSGHSATGGVITEYSSGSDAYRAHLFEGSGSFVVSSLGEIDNTVDIFLVGGGGGGGSSSPGSSWAAGGGGAGSAVLVPEITISAQTYPVVIGGG